MLLIPYSIFLPFFYDNAILKYIIKFFEYFYEEYKILVATNFPKMKDELPSYMDFNFILVGDLTESKYFGNKDYSLRNTIIKDKVPNLIEITIRNNKDSSIFLKNRHVKLALDK